MLRWNDGDESNEKAIDNHGYGLPLHQLQKGKNVEDVTKAQDMDSTFLTEIEELVIFVYFLISYKIFFHRTEMSFEQIKQGKTALDFDEVNNTVSIIFQHF